MNTNKWLSHSLKVFILVAIIALMNYEKAFPHPGHTESVAISRSSHPYLQKTILHYLKIQEHLAAAGSIGEELRTEAKAMKKIMERAAKKETDRSGKKMFKGVADSASLLIESTTIREVSEEFSQLSDILLPFFNDWPSHVREHNLILCICEKSKRWWLQKKITPSSPYKIGINDECGKLIVKK